MAGSTLLWLVVVATIVGGGVELVLAAVAYRHRETPAARSYAWLSLAAAGWSVFELAYILTTDPAIAQTAFRITNVFAYQVAILWLVFAIVYTGHREWLSPGRFLALWAPLTLFTLVRATSPLHGVLENPLPLVTQNGIVAPVYQQTPDILVPIVVGYLYLFGGYVLFASFLLESRNVYRKQAAAIAVGGLFPAAGTVAYTLGIGVHPGVSLTPPMFAVHGVVVAFALFRYDFLAVAPIASDVLVDELPEPVLVLDDDGMVIDHNPAATRLVDGEGLADRHVDDVVSDFSTRMAEGGRATIDAPGYDRAVSVFDIQVTPIEDQFDRPRGRLVLLRDLSTQHRQLEQLEGLQSATQEFITARTVSEVAEIAVEFASDVYDQPYAAMFVHDGDTDTLISGAMTDRLTAELGTDSIQVPRDSGPLWQTFTGEEGAATRLGDGPLFGAHQFQPSSVLALPLRERGVLVVATDGEEEYGTAEKQLGQILARTIETALTRIEHEEELRASRTAIERRNQQIEFFNGVLRHNIRNAMLVINGHAQFLESRVDGGTDELATIREWCTELTELTEKIRAINDTVTASERERLEQVDLSAVLHDQADMLRERYDEVRVDCDADAELPVAANDLVVDVVESVMLNAVEHNDAPVPHVDVSTRSVGDWIQLRVADNGPGLSDEMKTRVFQRDMATSQTADGFGLYFVSVMMDLYKGNVWFEDRHDLPEGQIPDDADDDRRGTVVVLEFQRAHDVELTAVEDEVSSN